VRPPVAGPTAAASGSGSASSSSSMASACMACTVKYGTVQYRKLQKHTGNGGPDKVPSTLL
jgi:hypothetical protein